MICKYNSGCCTIRIDADSPSGIASVKNSSYDSNSTEAVGICLDSKVAPSAKSISISLFFQVRYLSVRQAIPFNLHETPQHSTVACLIVSDLRAKHESEIALAISSKEI